MKDYSNFKVAIVHYWLVGMRGGEKVVESLCKIFPQADIFTHVYDRDSISDQINSHTIKTTYIQNLPNSKKLYRQYLPLMPSALERLDLTDYDLVISSEAGPAKGVIVRPDATHICYCHSPMRYLWDQFHQYYGKAGLASRVGMSLLGGRLRRWDVTSAARVDHFVANSRAVAARIKKYWRREARVIAPPVNTPMFLANSDREDYYLHVGEFVPYKRVDLAIEACNQIGRRLVIIGDGPEQKNLKAIAGPTIEFRGRVSDKELAESYAKCKALLFPAEEDFGIVPVEAMSTGAPVIAFNRGGARDYVIPNVTGTFVDKQSPRSFAESMIRFERQSELFNSQKISQFARRFDERQFRAQLKTFIDEVLLSDEDYRLAMTTPPPFADQLQHTGDPAYIDLNRGREHVSRSAAKHG